MPKNITIYNADKTNVERLERLAEENGLSVSKIMSGLLDASIETLEKEVPTKRVIDLQVEVRL